MLLAFSVQLAYGQSRTVTGTVTGPDGPVPGAAVLEKGTENGTATNAEGMYTIEVSGPNAVLVFQAIGLESQRKKVGSKTTIDVDLQKSSEELDEVVVTALGISRKKRSLGYASQEVSGDVTTTAKSANFTNALQGKVAGLQIKSSGTMGGSSNTIIRGFKSLTGNNQALYVVDGIPISNDVNNTSNQRTGRGGYDYGNNAMDLNPEDIANINVLKGAAATALYGSRAANGAIIITTKKGESAKGDGTIGVSVNSRFGVRTIDPSTMPAYQQEYGPGYGDYYNPGYRIDANGDTIPTNTRRLEVYDVDGDGGQDLVAPMGEDASYGAAFADYDKIYTWESIYPELETFGQAQDFEPGANTPVDFYETGTTLSNNVALTGSNDQGNFRLSFTQLEQEGVLPNSSISRYNADLSAGWNFSERLKVNTTVKYINTQGNGRFGTGYDSRNVNQSFRQWYNVGVDMERQRQAYELNNNNVSWNAFGYGRSNALEPHYFDNPYYNRYENFQNDERNRFIGKVEANYMITPWLTAVGRYSVDNYSSIQEERIAYQAVGVPLYQRRDFRFTETNAHFRLDFRKNLSDKLDLYGNLGVNSRRTTNESINAQTNGGLVVPDVYSLSNSVNPIEAPVENSTVVGVDGLFALVSLGYDDFLYLDVTGRNDWSSTLPTSSNSYFYPSATLSFVFSEFMEDQSILDFGKLRINYAEVGNSAPAQSTQDFYNLQTPFNGIALASAPATRNNPNLRPENTQSFEVGTELRFLKNRLGVDLSYYKSSTFNQILPTQVSTASGSFFQFVNAGQIDNEGVEVSLTGTPVQTGKFRWDAFVNWSLNRNTVVELFGQSDKIILASVQGGINIVAEEGQPYGAIEGSNFEYTDYTKDDNGNRVPTDDAQVVVYDHPAGGVRYRRTTSPETLGNIQPDWNMGVGNTFSYGPFSLYALIDIQQGGQFFSLDTWYGYGTGIYDFTTGTNDKGNPVRSNPENGGGLQLEDPYGNGLAYETTDGSGNTVYEDNTEYGNYSYFGNSSGWATAPNALHVYDASFVKLRELSIDYRVPAKVLEGTFLTRANIGLYGRNLWIIHKNAPHTDPEAGLSAGNIQGYQSGAYPMAREYGVKIGFNF
jgi:TonB-linked SusC/RagA family outer membrane protein